MCKFMHTEMSGALILVLNVVHSEASIAQTLRCTTQMMLSSQMYWLRMAPEVSHATLAKVSSYRVLLQRIQEDPMLPGRVSNSSIQMEGFLKILRYCQTMMLRGSKTQFRYGARLISQ